jgi:FkbM family methyltransferase
MSPEPMTVRARVGAALPAPVRRAIERWRATHAPAYEPEFSKAIREWVRPGSVCADVGGNVGEMTVYLARLAGTSGRVVAFEPVPGNVATLRGAVEAAGVSASVTVEEAAVSDGSAASVWLHPGRGRSHAEWNIMGRDVDGVVTDPEIEVRSLSLDQYFGDGPLDFVKIDVEGAEGKVLAGMTGLLERVRPVVAVEFHYDEAWAERGPLLDAGYELRDLDGNVIPPDGPRAYQCLALPPGR